MLGPRLRGGGQLDWLDLVLAGGVAGREGGQTPGVECTAMCVFFDGEEDVFAADVLVCFRARARVPVVSGELVVGPVEEVLALMCVLADEEHVGWSVPVAVRGLLPPVVEEGVVAPELVVVLVEPTGAIELDEHGGRLVEFAVARELEDGVGP